MNDAPLHPNISGFERQRKREKNVSNVVLINEKFLNFNNKESVLKNDLTPFIKKQQQHGQIRKHKATDSG